MATLDKNDATVLLRLPSELKALLQREAAINGRRITSEINMRLKASLESTGVTQATPPGTLPRSFATLKSELAEASSTERALFGLLRRLPPDKQRALLAFLK